MKKIFYSLIICVIITFYSDISKAAPLISLDNLKWIFVSKNDNTVFIHNIHSRIAPAQINNTCQGNLNTTISKEILNQIIGKTLNPALFFPRLAYAHSIYINENLYKLNGYDYSSAGPVIPINQYITVSDLTLKIALKEVVCDPFIGPLTGFPVLGEYEDLIKMRDLSLIHQKAVPLVLAVVFLILSIIFFWLYKNLQDHSPVFLSAVFAYLSWSIFSLFLSGEVRVFLPELGERFHIAARLLVSATLSYFSCQLFSLSRRISYFTAVSGGIIFGLGILFGIYHNLTVQIILYSISIISFIILTFITIHKNKYFYKNIYNIGMIITSIGFFNDLIKTLLSYFGKDYKIIYLNRYVTSLFLLLAVIELAKRAIYFKQREYELKLKEHLLTQVAHDIRAPLAVLKMIIPRLGDLQTQEKGLLFTASERIQDIADNLLASKRKNQSKIGINELTPLIESLISEKNFQHSRNIVFFKKSEFDHNQNATLRLNPSELKQTLSNLVNNSIDALGSDGKVQIELEINNTALHILIKDNGRGIPQHIIPRLMEHGATFGKHSGNGLGLFYAKKLMDSCQGSISIESTQNIGTTVKLIIPFLYR